MLLSRHAFKEAVFDRDNSKCVVCSAPAVDAHHILDRKLWPDGGYYLQNGVSVCAKCHWDAEVSNISCAELRSRAGIDIVLVPPDMDPTVACDKWGRVI